MCFVLVSVFRPLISSLAPVFLVAQLFVIVRLLWRCQLCVCYHILVLLCEFLCVGTCLSRLCSVYLSVRYCDLCCVHISM